MNGNNHSKFLGVTPMDERKRFIRHMFKDLDFTIDEIREIYPTMSRARIKSVIENKNGSGLW